jgi:phosphoribosylanthranilate isomerase
MKIKICGLTTLNDALAASAAGADLLGFNFYPKSPRYLTPEACANITRELRRRGCSAALVGVFVNPTRQEVVATLAACGLDLAQLCGDESPALLQSLGECAFKALRPTGVQQLHQALADYPLRSQPPALLIDAYRPGEYGGTGQAANWRLAADCSRRVTVLLAGGLTPTNVTAAIQQVRPWGVDVASGVESTPGKKDQNKMIAFIQAVRLLAEKETQP